MGDEAVLLGSFGPERIGAEELADRSGTIPYEVLTRLGKRVVRVYHGGRDTADRGFAILRRPAASDLASPGR